jgi:hypothetical protein
LVVKAALSSLLLTLLEQPADNDGDTAAKHDCAEKGRCCCDYSHISPPH